MTAYELMIKTNDYLLRGGTLTDGQKKNITGQLLAAVSSRAAAERFYKGVKFPNNTNSDGSRMYPEFFIPPYNDGRKYKTFMSITPKTHILSANSCELEIIRLMYILAPEDKTARDMAEKTLERLKTTCYGSFCAAGECFETSEIALRFISSVSPEDTRWMKRLVSGIGAHMDDKRRHSGALWYYWLCLSEQPEELVIPEIARYKKKILEQINRSRSINNEQDKFQHTQRLIAARNCLVRLPELRYLKEREPYIKHEDGRICFDMSYGESVLAGNGG